MFFSRIYAHELSIVRFAMLMCVLYLFSPFYVVKVQTVSTKVLSFVRSISITNYLDLSKTSTLPVRKARHSKMNKYLSKFDAIKTQKIMSKYSVNTQIKVTKHGYQVIAPYPLNIRQSKLLRYAVGGKLS